MSDGTGGAIATLLAASDYVDQVVLEREREAIFARTWLFVTDAASLAQPGRALAADAGSYPIIVVNDGGTLRAVHNVCRHRGGPLLAEGISSCTRFVCQYHGWSYDLDGALRSARDFGDDTLEKADYALHSVRVESWRGLVFVCLDAQAPSLIDWLGGLVAECAVYDIESFHVEHSSSHHIECNWKVYAENYQEGYHIPLVHPGLNKQVDARAYNVDVRDGFSVHTAPTRDGSVTSGAWLWKFPGLALNLYPNGMCIETYVPTGATSTRVNYVFLFDEHTPADEIQASIASSDAILEEDRLICEAVQRNMSSGLYAGGVLSPRHERGVLDVQRQVQQALARR